MALSGQIFNTFRTGYQIRMDWSASQDITNNKSTVTATFYLVSLGSSYTISSTAAKALSITIDGQTFNHSVYVGLTGNQTKLLATSTKDVYHNTDGTRRFGLSGALAINVTLSGVYYGTIEIPYTEFDLDTIPRATTPTLNYSTREMGQSINISVAPASGAFSHKIYYAFTGIGNTLIATLPAGNQTHAWTIPTATLAPQIPNALSGTVTITAETYSGSTLIGTKQTTFEATVPDYQPSASLTLTGVDLYSSRYVQGKSKVTVDITAAGLYGSSISTYRTTANGTTYNTTSLTTDVLVTSGTNTIETTVTDSRGKQKVVSSNITVEAYTAPTATYLTAARSTSGGTLDPSGAYIKATVQASISTIANTNTKSTKVLYKKKADSTWTTAYTNTSTYTTDTSVVFAADGNYSYDVKLEVADYYSTVARETSVGTAFTLMDFHSGGQSMAVGKVAEGNGLLEMGGEVLSSGTFNRGSFNAPTKGAVTQVIDESYNQHSVIVGKNASGTRVYGMDLYDQTADPVMRLYAGDKYMQLGSTGLVVNGNSLKKEVLGETVLMPVSWSYFRCTQNTTMANSLTLPLTKTGGDLVISNGTNITLPKGYAYSWTIGFNGVGNYRAYIYLYQYLGGNQTNIPNTISSGNAYSSTINGSQGYGNTDLTNSANDMVVVAFIPNFEGSGYIEATVNGGANILGGIQITKYKKITI